MFAAELICSGIAVLAGIVSILYDVESRAHPELIVGFHSLFPGHYRPAVWAPRHDRDTDPHILELDP
jgi:hypothetical protein